MSDSHLLGTIFDGRSTPPEEPRTAKLPAGEMEAVALGLSRGGTQGQTPEQAAAAALSDPVGIPGFESLGVLGRGGMGVVFKARQTSLDRVVALKMILSGSHAEAEERERFQREAEVVAQLRHPNVVQIYAVGEHHGSPYLALEYVEGGTLASLLNRRPRSPDWSARLVETVARAVQAAHDHDIVHHDLKPATC